MAKSLDTGVLPVDPAGAAIMIGAALGLPVMRTSHSFGGLNLTAYVIKVEGLDGVKMEVRIRDEGGNARVLVDIFM